VNTTFDLLGHDLLNAAFWMDVRKAQDASRNFGDGPTAAWTAFRKIVPLLPTLDGSPSQPRPMTAVTFLKTTPASKFYAGGEMMPTSSEKQ
jgi:histidine ammonia-lyase